MTSLTKEVRTTWIWGAGLGCILALGLFYFLNLFFSRPEHIEPAPVISLAGSALEIESAAPAGRQPTGKADQKVWGQETQKKNCDSGSSPQKQERQ